jgi:hypothetical protein
MAGSWLRAACLRSISRIVFCSTTGTDRSHLLCFAETVVIRARTGSGVPCPASDGDFPETQGVAAELVLEGR